MRTAAVAFVLACLVSVLLTPLVRRFALTHNLLDEGRSWRRIHGRPIPRLGGIGIAAGFYTPLLALLLQSSAVGDMFYTSGKALAFLAGGLAICTLGLYDDLRGAGAGKKFLIQFAVAGGLYAAGFRVDEISLPFAGSVALHWLSIPFTLIWIVGVINAMNLIDGLDGLAAGVALFALGTAFVMAAMRGDPIMMLFMAALGGATLGFLVYNFHPASIFMGDTGSMFLGYVLGVGAIQTSQKSSTVVAILVPLVALGVPIADTLLAMLRRLANRQPIFSADRAHIHHRLLDLGLSQRQAVAILYAVSIALGGLALLLTFANSTQTALLLVVMVAFGFLAIRALKYGKRLQPLPVAGAPAAPAAPMRFVALAQSAHEWQLWRELKAVAEALGARAVRLHIEGLQDGDPVSIARSHGTWDEGDAPVPAPAPAVVEIAVGSVTVRAECLHESPLDAAALEDVETALEAACERMFDAGLDPRAHRTDGSAAASA
jgi:UDP-GlcNAc:undecaprenyl-phosphate GlcNAc-1-phosphate transferase